MWCFDYLLIRAVIIKQRTLAVQRFILFEALLTFFFQSWIKIQLSRWKFHFQNGQTFVTWWIILETLDELWFSEQIYNISI